MTTQEPRDQNAQSAEEELRSERIQFALAERAGRLGYWRLRLADNHLTWSPGMYRLLGVDPSQKPDNAWLLAQITDEDVTLILERIAHGIKTRSPFYYRSRAKDAVAQAQIVDTHGEIEVGSDGRVVSIIGVCRDVTAQVNAEADREKAQRVYRVVAEEASDIIMLQEEKRIVFASRALERILNRKPEEIEDGAFLGLVHPDDLHEALKLKGRPPPGAVWSGTWRARHGNGHWVWVENRTRAVYDEETGAFLYEITVVRDVTERKEHELKMLAAQERAEAANRAKSLFLANMSHELRTPLNAVIGFADMMCGEVFGALGHERYREYAQDIRNSGNHLLDLITGVLDIAKVEAGKLELNFEPVDLHESVEECTHLLRVSAKDAGIALHTDLRAAQHQFTADRRAVKQILLNLLSNAIKFTPAGGQIVVETRTHDGRLVVAVRDTGIGIPGDQIARLGQPFEQVCTDPMLAKGGSGLGLALVQALAERHGGEMRIESEEGLGTTVTVDFPLTTSAHAAA